MSASALYRPSALQFCNSTHEPASWSPSSSDSGDESCDAEVEADTVDSEERDDESSSSSSQTHADRLPSSPAPASAPAPGPASSTTTTASPLPRQIPSPALAAGSSSYPRATPAPAFRARLTPMQPIKLQGGGAKASPMSRSLLARAVSGASGCGPTQPKKTTKLIVPTKSFRTTFELGLSSTELARKA